MQQANPFRWLGKFIRHAVLAAVFLAPMSALPATVEQLQAILDQTIQEDGPEHANVADVLNALALQLYRQGQYAQALTQLQRALAIREKALGPDHPDVATSLNNLASLHKAQGQYAEALPLYRRSLTIWEKALGPDHPDVATSLNNLAALYQAQGQYAEALLLCQRSLAILEKALGDGDPRVAGSLSNLAMVYKIQGRYAQALPLYQRALAILEKARGPDHPDVATVLNNLAALYQAQGQYAQALPRFQQALAIREKAFGPDHPDVAVSLNALAALYEAQGQDAQALPLYQRAQGIWEQSFGPDHPLVATGLNNIALLHQIQGRYVQALPLLQRALAIWEKVLGPAHPDVASSLDNLAQLHQAQGQYAQALPLMQRALAIREKALGPDHPDVAISLNNLALLYKSQRQYAEALPLYQRALTIWEKAQGHDHLDVAFSLNNLARLEQELGHADKALELSRRAVRILRTRFAQGSDDISGADALSEQKTHRGDFSFLIRMLSSSPDSGSESFEAGQLAQASGVGRSVAQMAARFAAGDDALAKAVRSRQDDVEQLRVARKQLDDLLGAPRVPGYAEKRENLRQRVAERELSLQAKTASIRKHFPVYDALVSPAPVALAEAQKLLRRSEALLVYLVDDLGVFAWAASPDAAEFRRLDISAEELTRMVSALRDRLDPEQNPDVQPYDSRLAHQLYVKVFAPLVPALRGASHVIVVADGALQSLPFSVLVGTPPEPGKPAAFLSDRHAFSVIPSVSSLRALRAFSRGAPGTQPLVGFGNPILEGGPGSARRLAARALFVRGVAADAPAHGNGIADVEAIRHAAPLPETAHELRTLADAVGAMEDSLYLQTRATETTVKQIDLSPYRVVAFATHGVMAGELSGVAEPGLLLTPPATGTLVDDGYLSASEVAQLKLNADLVMLSACNTAAPDGRPGAEGLSGLAKAFFYAGARTLLVSNWYVVSDAALLLTTQMLQSYAQDSHLGKAEALRRAMVQMQADPRYSHPLYWAPFSIVGEGQASQ